MCNRGDIDEVVPIEIDAAGLGDYWRYVAGGEHTPRRRRLRAVDAESAWREMWPCL
jgi:hypothetical protein